MQNDLKIDKYALMKMFQYEHQLQVYMYDFMYVDREAMAEEEYFSDTKTVVENYKNMSTPGPVTIFFAWIRLHTSRILWVRSKLLCHRN